MRKLLLCMGAFLFLCLTGCSNDDDDEQSYADIVGTWELVSFYTIVGHYEVPEDERDLFVFGSDRKVKVIKKLKRPYLPLFPNEDGEFDYSYNKGKQKIHFFGVERDCIILDDEMRMEGNHSADDGMEVFWYIFNKKQI